MPAISSESDFSELDELSETSLNIDKRSRNSSVETADIDNEVIDHN